MTLRLCSLLAAHFFPSSPALAGVLVPQPAPLSPVKMCSERGDGGVDGVAVPTEGLVLELVRAWRDPFLQNGLDSTCSCWHGLHEMIVRKG